MLIQSRGTNNTSHYVSEKVRRQLKILGNQDTLKDTNKSETVRSSNHKADTLPGKEVSKKTKSEKVIMSREGTNGESQPEGKKLRRSQEELK